jgi:hypothetical protein
MYILKVWSIFNWVLKTDRVLMIFLLIYRTHEVLQIKWFLRPDNAVEHRNLFPSFQTALLPGVGLGLLYNTPPSFSVPCSVPPSADTHLSQIHGHPSSSHLIFGLPLRLVACSFPYSIFLGIAVSCILSTWPSHGILWYLINLTIFSLLIVSSYS